MGAAGAIVEENRGLPEFITRANRKERKAAKRAAKMTPQVQEKHPRDYNQLEHRLKHDDHELGGQDKGGVKTHKMTDPLRIDKLLKNGVIDESQHDYGTQIIALWSIASKPLIGSMKYTDVRTIYNIESGEVSRMTAEDQFFRTMLYLTMPSLDYLAEMHRNLMKPLSRKERHALKRQIKAIEEINKKASRRNHDFIVSICLDEMGVLETARMLGVAVNDAVECTRRAFDALGEALAKMRNHRKELKKRMEASVTENLRTAYAPQPTS